MFEIIESQVGQLDPARPVERQVVDPMLLRTQGQEISAASQRILAPATERPILRHTLDWRLLDVGTGVAGITLEATKCRPSLRVEGTNAWEPALVMARKTKPFGLRGWLARIRAVLRRREANHVASHRDSEPDRYRFGGWQLDRRDRRLTDPDGASATLPNEQYALLIELLDAPQRPLSREYLLRVTRVHADIFDRTIDVYILRLRRKLEADPSRPRLIQTERGVGYVFALPVERLWLGFSGIQ
jgi:DNA-binding winged helix-turn-helix (wHTH) protein